MTQEKQMVSLSIVMPVYNESGTIRSAVERVLAVDYPCPVELIVVDDGSSDDTASILRGLAESGLRLLCHERNLGKGAAVRTGVGQATGSHMIVLDADLEYSPRDIPSMLRPVIDGHAHHVFGTRVFGLNTRYQSFRFAMGGRALTLAANLLYDSCLTDMHTCLKLLPIADFRAMRLSEDGFGLDTIRAGVRPFEVPVSYHGRSVEQGKKIGWRDGMRSLSILTRVRAERYPQQLPGIGSHAVVAPTLTPDPAPITWRPMNAPVTQIPSPATGVDSDKPAVAI
jgi:dolichol-phosphate hexosyltransferase